MARPPTTSSHCSEVRCCNGCTCILYTYVICISIYIIIHNDIFTICIVHISYVYIYIYKYSYIHSHKKTWITRAPAGSKHCALPRGGGIHLGIAGVPAPLKNPGRLTTCFHLWSLSFGCSSRTRIGISDPGNCERF